MRRGAGPPGLALSAPAEERLLLSPRLSETLR